MSQKIVLGIDGGGTYTRAMAADLTGNVLASAQAGSASPGKARDARENVQQAICDVVAQAGRQMSDVACLVAGLAGLDGPEDQGWAEEFTGMSGLTCPRHHVNDAVVAHAGALASRPGIVVIAGTGSIVFGVTEAGRQVRNYDFHHAPGTSARHLAYETVYSLLAGDAGPEDAQFVGAVLAFWQVGHLEALREIGLNGFDADWMVRNRRFGEMAPLVTAAAARGVPLAARVCDQAAKKLGTGVKLVGGCFAGNPIPVVLVGGMIRSDYMRRAMARVLVGEIGCRYRITEASLSGAAGAILMALEHLGISPDEGVRARLGDALLSV